MKKQILRGVFLLYVLLCATTFGANCQTNTHSTQQQSKAASAQSSEQINLVGTVWDMGISFGPGKITGQCVITFEANGIFTVAGATEKQRPNTWKWENSKLLMTMNGKSGGGIFTGQVISETRIEGTMNSEYGVFLEMKNLAGGDKIKFTMKPKTK